MLAVCTWRSRTQPLHLTFTLARIIDGDDGGRPQATTNHHHARRAPSVWRVVVHIFRSLSGTRSTGFSVRIFFTFIYCRYTHKLFVEFENAYPLLHIHKRSLRSRRNACTNGVYAWAEPRRAEVVGRLGGSGRRSIESTLCTGTTHDDGIASR